MTARGATRAERLADLGYAAGWRLVRTLPEPVARGLFRAGADVAARRGGPGALRLRRNLSRVVPHATPEELDALVRAGLRSYARYWMEAFRLPSMDPREVHRRVDEAATGTEHLDKALADGKGVVLALTHSGNWDAVGIWLARGRGRFTTVAERLKPESLYDRFVAYRESLGFEVIAATGGERNPAVVLSERLRENGMVCLLADRDLTPGGKPVTFFGAETKMPAGPAYLAARTGAALVPVACWFTEDGWGLRFHPPLSVGGVREVPAVTQALADVFAADIAERPQDWHMLQNLWLEDVP